MDDGTPVAVWPSVPLEFDGIARVSVGVQLAWCSALVAVDVSG